jgi:hypothetical protein
LAKLAKMANISGTEKTRIFDDYGGCRAMRWTSIQDRGHVRTAQMPLPGPDADPLRDRPESATTDRPPVHLDDREYAIRGAIEDSVVGGVEIVPGEIPLLGAGLSIPGSRLSV